MKLFERLALAERYSEPCAVLTLIAINGSAPRTEGRMAVFSDGSSVGTIGGGAMERNAVKEAIRVIKSGKSQLVKLKVRNDSMAEVYIDVPIKDRNVLIIGAGHVSKAVSRLFEFLSWRVTVLDSRPEVVDPDDFPNARVVLDENIENGFKQTTVDSNTAIVITNPEDGSRLMHLLEKCDAFYIGMLGSRKKDFSKYKFLHAPMGLDLGGETPEDVALSITSEVVACFNKKNGKPNNEFRNRLVIVRGAGDLATGTIIKLFNAGYKVIALECDKPTVIRRTVAFASCYYSGEIEIEGVKGVLAKDIPDSLNIMDRGELPVLVDPEGDAIKTLKPSVVVDAILAKKNLGTTKDMANLVIGLGPGFCAGEDVDLVIETKRGHSLGRIITTGPAIANSGIPGVIAGYGKERVIHSPANGVFKGVNKIGDIVSKGDVIAYVSSTPVIATIDGCLRGLLHDGLEVPEGFKIADIDPRGKDAEWTTISDKAKAIGGGVLEAVDSFYAHL